MSAQEAPFDNHDIKLTCVTALFYQCNNFSTLCVSKCLLFASYIFKIFKNDVCSALAKGSILDLRF